MSDATMTRAGFIRPRSPVLPRPDRGRPGLLLVPLIVAIVLPTGAMLGASLVASEGEPEAADLIRALEARRQFKVDGKGPEVGPRLAVAVLDSGLNEAHVDFAGYERIPTSRNFTREEGGVTGKARADQAVARAAADRATQSKVRADQALDQATAIAQAADAARSAADKVAADAIQAKVKAGQTLDQARAIAQKAAGSPAAAEFAADARTLADHAAREAQAAAVQVAAGAEATAKRVSVIATAGVENLKTAKDTAERAAEARSAADRAAAAAQARADAAAATDVTDRNGHGSHVSGIVVAHGRHTGVAPGANVVPIKIVDAFGGTDIATIDRGLRWVLENHNQYNITVVLLALGDLNNYPDDDSAVQIRNPNDQKVLASIRDTIRALRSARVATVAAAGNRWFYFNARDKPGKVEQGMCQPGILRETISVGSVYDKKHGARTYPAGGSTKECIPGRITPFSQRLHETVNPACRTDIFAPGGEATSSGKNGLDSESVEQGTAQAAAVTAGVVLLLQDYYLRMTRRELPSVEDLEYWIRGGSIPTEDKDDGLDDVKHTGLMFPRLDVYGAFETLRADLAISSVTGAWWSASKASARPISRR